MKKKIKALPLSLCGLILSFSLLTVLFSESPVIKAILYTVSLLLFVFFSLKLLLIKDSLFDSLNDSVDAAMLGTYPMIFSVFSILIQGTSPLVGLIFWWIGLVLQVFYMIWYTMKFLTPIKIGEFMPSSYIIFVGITISAATSSKFHLEAIGKLIFLISAALFILITPFVFRNVFLKNRLTSETRPIGAIVAMPFSLLSLAYMDSFMIPTDNVIIFFIFTSFFFFSMAIVSIVFSHTGKFNKYLPSYVFPVVISSVAMKKASSVLLESKNFFAFLARRMYLITKATAVVLTVYVLIMFILQIIKIYKSIGMKKKET